MSSKRSTGFINAEDQLLVEKFLEISQDPITSTSQTSVVFWKRVAEAYNVQKKEEWVPRSFRSIQTRMGKLQKEVGQFLVFEKEVENLHRNGVSESDILRDARRVFAEKNNKSFRFDHVYDQLKDFGKFKDHNECVPPRKIPRKHNAILVSSSSENSTPDSHTLSSFSIHLDHEGDAGGSSFNFTDNNFETPQEHLRHTGKKYKMKKKIDETLYSNVETLKNYTSQVVEIMNKTCEQMNEYNVLQKQKLEYKMLRREDKILAMDLNDILDTNLRMLYYNQQQEIIRKRTK
ncbi:uncharacterized protein LOC127259238 [Andrographis paniculata]|uniref:uncharacterized protein LOC127259238 n=1 Tax=Andrographis paniculata TaxID=175694 RepID=UPI0021E7A721|nr:uncharacterized protein LOC127259238 [Andrographis paniculata]